MRRFNFHFICINWSKNERQYCSIDLYIKHAVYVFLCIGMCFLLFETLPPYLTDNDLYTLISKSEVIFHGAIVFPRLNASLKCKFDYQKKWSNLHTLHLSIVPCHIILPIIWTKIMIVINSYEWLKDWRPFPYSSSSRSTVINKLHSKLLPFFRLKNNFYHSNYY